MSSSDLARRVSPRLNKLNDPRSSPRSTPLPPRNGRTRSSSTHSMATKVSDLAMSQQLIRRRSPRLSPTGQNLEIRREKPPKSAEPKASGDGLALTLVVSDLSALQPQSLRRSSPRLAPQTHGELVGRERDASTPETPRAESNSSAEQRKRRRCRESFIGDPFPEDEARRRWPWHYQEQGRRSNRDCAKSNNDDEDDLVKNVKCHYAQAEMGKQIFNLGDYAYIKGEKGCQNYVGKLLEFFKTVDDEDYCRVQWLFRAEDTVMKEEAEAHDTRRLFFSDLKNDNILECIVSKVNIVEIPPRVHLKPKSLAPCDYFYDMKYSVDYSTFCTMVTDRCLTPLSSCDKIAHINIREPTLEGISSHKPGRPALTLLDVYSGCGGMSTGLCLGAKISGVDLATRWAIDADKSACDSLQLNHPETQVRNESAEDFLDLLKEWTRLCRRYATKNIGKITRRNSMMMGADQVSSDGREIPSGEFEVSRLVDICYGDPINSGKRRLMFQVRWAGYGPSEDTWEPIEGLCNCQDQIQDFVLKGQKAQILPCPGDVDVICGGPPCQGISGYNRFRNEDSPLDDERNRQIIVFMDIVNFLKPKYVIMENVVDILKFAKGSLARFALSRLIHMNYQARLGIMAAGCYGLPQFRLRVFLWGAHPLEKLPQFPLPTHDVVLKYGAPSEFERNVVAYDEGQTRNLEKALVLSDAITDLPQVTTHETRKQMSYGSSAETEFQRFIRAPKCEMDLGIPVETQKPLLFDHRPLPLSEDDYLRVCKIPRRKGANYRDLPGVCVGPDNVARRDPKTEVLLPSGKQMVPDYALNFCEGKSVRPFARLWWDETVPTVFCRPDHHSQVVLHPVQDRILTIRENARLQGFPDYYNFCGDVKERYRQIGNAVAIPVARALGYTLGMAVQKLGGEEHLMTLPRGFSNSTALQLLQSS